MPAGVVPFPRGFAFGGDGRLFLASGIGPTGDGDDTIIAFAPGGAILRSWLVKDAELSPLDLIVAANGNIVVSSEWPFAAADALATVRGYDSESSRLVRVFSTEKLASFRKAHRLRFGPDSNFTALPRTRWSPSISRADHVLALVHFPRLYGQALAFFPQ